MADRLLEPERRVSAPGVDVIVPDAPFWGLAML